MVFFDTYRLTIADLKIAPPCLQSIVACQFQSFESKTTTTAFKSLPHDSTSPTISKYSPQAVSARLSETTIYLLFVDGDMDIGAKTWVIQLALRTISALEQGDVSRHGSIALDDSKFPTLSKRLMGGRTTTRKSCGWLSFRLWRHFIFSLDLILVLATALLIKTPSLQMYLV